MDINLQIAREIGKKQEIIDRTIALLDEGNTVPFIARYRKEMTGSMDESEIRTLSERLQSLRNLKEKKEDVIRKITEQDKMTDELHHLIMAAETLTEVEDYYLPYRPKKTTLATKAREKGLEPLAQLLLQKGDTEEGVLAEPFISEEKGVLTIEEALKGAMDIITEKIAERADYRKNVRSMVYRSGKIESSSDTTEKTPYEMYYAYEEKLDKVPPHRILAMNRGEKEKILTVKITTNDDYIITYLTQKNLNEFPEGHRDRMEKAVKDAYKKSIFPAVSREIRNELTEKAEIQAIGVFSKNLHHLLMQPPVKGAVILGMDPAYRTGCKMAVVDDTGKLLAYDKIFCAPPKMDITGATKIMDKLIEAHGITIITIGNGTASRETEQFVSDYLKNSGKDISYVIVNEAGASVYSASDVAREEYPDLDLTFRGAISIAKRLQDPLAELVKIEPKAIGVGQYQHDVAQKSLETKLTDTVEHCVNAVGVDLNTASPSLLSYVAGINKTIAKNIVAYRDQNHKFKNREQLKKVPRLGDAAFLQCAGFLRIMDGDNPLDQTAVHPESYDVAVKLLEAVDVPLNTLKTKEKIVDIRHKLKGKNLKNIAQELNVGDITLNDILDELSKPALDPRSKMPEPIFRKEVVKLEDLQPGMELMGSVINVLDFGCFVDIGVKQSGLVHLSQMSNRFIKHPMDVVHVGDIVKVKVLSIDVQKGRIQLTMK